MYGTEWHVHCQEAFSFKSCNGVDGLMQSNHKLILGMFGIGCVTTLEVVNIIYLGVNGGVLAGVCTGIGTIIGILVGRKVKS